MPGAPAKNVTEPDSPGFRGLVAAAIAESKITLLKSSGFETTPNAWKDFPALIVVTVTSSPEFTRISGLLPGSPGNALNANVLKSLLSTKSKVRSLRKASGARYGKMYRKKKLIDLMGIPTLTHVAEKVRTKINKTCCDKF